MTDFHALADDLQLLVYDLYNMSAGAGTYPAVVAADLRRIAAELEDDELEDDW